MMSLACSDEQPRSKKECSQSHILANIKKESVKALGKDESLWEMHLLF